MVKFKNAVEPLPSSGSHRLISMMPANGEESRKVSGITTIILIEKRSFLRECFAHALRSNSSEHVLAFPTIADWRESSPDVSNALVILSILTLTLEEVRRELLSLSTVSCAAPIIVLAEDDEPNSALDALLHGAKGYISSNVSLEFAMKAMHFVSAGGTYIPAECLTGAQLSSAPAPQTASGGPFTGRELAVIQLIRQGKSNKMIANTLNMCESTVKVHVRHIMKKTQTRNRTELAMMSGTLVAGLA